ncbi:Unknown protein [Striga hermonthica]|uniref:Uncharacterized protein n=1 Tax=Striga hermonthica TaxID=68872 RepID=A0A9N7N7X4_STRHE|nr:Unknown protein [Striga hermonthica]
MQFQGNNWRNTWKVDLITGLRSILPPGKSSATLPENKSPDLGKVFVRMMGFCICPLDTPARLLWCSSFFRHKLMLF